MTLHIHKHCIDCRPIAMNGSSWLNIWSIFSSFVSLATIGAMTCIGQWARCWYVYSIVMYRSISCSSTSLGLSHVSCGPVRIIFYKCYCRAGTHSRTHAITHALTHAVNTFTYSRVWMLTYCLTDSIYKIRTVATNRHFCRRLTDICRHFCRRRN